MLFQEIPGNETLKRKLASMCAEHRTGHAILFTEPVPCGALSFALALAQFLSCRNRQGDDACGKCPECLKFSKLIHPDLHFAFPVSASRSGSRPLCEQFLPAWRDLVLSGPDFPEEKFCRALGMEEKSGTISVQEAKSIFLKMSMRSYEGGNKYTILWLPERMTAEAANKLLKIIEEPYPDTYFFLVSRSPERILETVRSRCQRLDVLPEGHRIREDADPLFREAAFRLLQEAADRRIPALLAAGEKLWDLGRERQRHFCLYLETVIREMLLLRQGLEQLSSLPPSERDRFRGLSHRYSDKALDKAYAATEKARLLIESNVNAKSAFSVLCNFLYNSVTL